MWPKVFNRGGPQAGQRLADIAYGSLHYASPDRFTAGGEATGAVAMSEDLEDGDGIRVGGKAVVDVVLGAEGCPDGPGIFSGSGGGAV